MYHYSPFALTTFFLLSIIPCFTVALDQPASPRHSLPLLQDKSGKAVIYQWDNSFWCKLLRGVMMSVMMSWHETETSSELNCSAGQLKSAVEGWRVSFSNLFDWLLTLTWTVISHIPGKLEGEKKEENLSRTFEKCISTVKAVTRWSPLLVNSFSISSWA